MFTRCAALLLLLCLAGQPASAASPTVQMEEMTWTEVRDRIAAGATTVLIPIGGTEQNGPHMVLGKHNVRARVLAGMIAQRLGHALVAPVISYVPEGSIHPPAAHMRFAGTVSISEATFEALLQSAARSFKQHGFREVVFLGDHGGYQQSEERAAAALNREWAADPACRVHALRDYYRISQTDFAAALKKRGYSEAEIGTHAGLADTALAMAVDESLVRTPLLEQGSRWREEDGVYGDPRRATAELGRIGVEQIVGTSVAAIRAFTRPPR